MAKKIRIIVNGVSFYTTKKQIAEGVGDYIELNDCFRKIYKECIEGKYAGLGYTCYANDRRYCMQINL